MADYRVALSSHKSYIWGSYGWL